MRKKLILLVGIIVISSFSIGYITSILVSNNTPNAPIDDTPIDDIPKFYIATDDIWFTEYKYTPDYYFDRFRPDMNYLRVNGGEDGTANPDYSVMYIRFNLTNKPNNWSKCEISLYEFGFSKLGSYAVSFSVDLFEGNWNETSGNTEVYWKIERISHSLGYSIGFKKLDITNFIKNNETISMRIYARNQNKWRGSLSFYSSEWDGLEPDFPYILPENDTYLNYLPQLIWS